MQVGRISVELLAIYAINKAIGENEIIWRESKAWGGKKGCWRTVQFKSRLKGRNDEAEDQEHRRHITEAMRSKWFKRKS